MSKFYSKPASNSLIPYHSNAIVERLKEIGLEDFDLEIRLTAPEGQASNADIHPSEMKILDKINAGENQILLFKRSLP